MQLPGVKGVPISLDGVIAWSRRRAVQIILGLALLVGLALRLYGLNWDQGFMFHPDERAILMKVEGGLSLPLPIDIGQLLDPKTSPLNPHWFAYGTLPLYILKLAGHILSLIKETYAAQDLRLVGRAISAAFDAGTIYLVYIIGRRVFDRRVGLLGAVFVSLSVIDIQLSHFYAVDVMLAFLLTLTVYFCINLAQRQRDRDVVLVGICLGLSFAVKVSTAPILAPVIVALILNARAHGVTSWSQAPDLRPPSPVPLFLNKLFAILVVAAVAFFLAAPFSILDHEAFLANVTEQSGMVRRILDYPYTRQYIDTPPYLYHMTQLSTWGFGPVLGVIAWGGLAFATLAALIRRRWGDILLISWVLPYFAVTGAFEVKFLRYLLPIAPVLCLMGARLLFSLRDFAPQIGNKARIVSNVIIGIAVAATALYALAYMNVYSLPHPAVRMSEWINANVPKGALILKEHWEEGIPNLGAYRGGDLNLYENDDAKKLNHIVTQVRGGDYIVFFSNRLYGTIPRLPERYPLTSRYYDLLFKGELGYELVDAETAYPSLPGVTITDDTFGRPKLPVPRGLSTFLPSGLVIDGGFADESFTVYDHPKVMLFKKVKQFSDQELRGMFSSISLNRPPPDLSTEPGLLLSEADAKANQEGGTWSELFDRNDIANRLPALSWLVMVELISLAVFPLGTLLFRRLADRGFILTKILGILAVSYLSWLFAATHVLTFSRLTIVLSLVLVALFSTYLFFRFRQEIESFVRTRWRLLVGLEALFLLAFFAFYLVRLANPDLWHAWRGGEKPMDFAYLNAVIKTTYFPPYDPWFSGGYLNYYYFGQVIVATLIKLGGIVPAVAYNLALPLLFSLTLSGAFSIGYDLVLAARTNGGRPGWRWAALLCGSLAAVMVAVLGNIDGIIQVAEGLAKAGNFNIQSSIPGLSGTVNASVGLWRALVDHQPLPAFDFWRSSRMMPGTINITEFPYFTFLFADLHAHLIALPFTVLAIGLALNLALRPRRSGDERTVGRCAAASVRGDGSPLFIPRYRGRLPLASLIGWLGSILPLPRLFPVLALALALGALRIINSWDFPTYLLLSIAAIFIGEFSSRGGIGYRTVFWFIAKAGAIFWLSSFLYQPFHDKYELFYAGIEPSQEKTLFDNYVAIHGLFLFSVVSYLVFALARFFGRSGGMRTLFLLARRWEDLPHLLGLWRRLVKKPDPGSATLAYCLVVVLLVSAVLALAKLYLIAMLLVILAMAVSLAFGELVKREVGMSPRLFVLTLVGFAIALGIGVDFITIKGDVGRMNTVFKFYLQAWVLFSLASAYGLVAVLDGKFGVRRQRIRAADKRIASHAVNPENVLPVRETSEGQSVGAVPPWPPPSPRGRHGGPATTLSKQLAIGPWKVLWLVVLAVLLLSTAIYPIAATRVRMQDRFEITPPTDDGMAYMKTAVYSDEKGKVELGYDYEAITWMQDNLKGTPVIVEAFTPLYRWGSRVSIYTGMPTVIGWDWHQTQQRMPYRWMIESRMKDVKDIYMSTDQRLTMDLLRKYGVKYIYVGELERLYYGGPGLAKFEQMAKADLGLVHENQTVKIYEVK